MNNQRRKTLQRALDSLAEVLQVVTDAHEEEQEYFDNMPESFQDSERGEIAQVAIDALDMAVSAIEEAVSNLEEAQQ